MQLLDWSSTEDCLSRSHHLSVCLSALEPSAAILSLNYSTQHIPVNHTHACMHAHTHLQVKFKTSQCEALWARSHNCSDIILNHDLMYCLFFFFYFWLAGTIIEKLCSQEGLVTRWHISYMSFKSFKLFRHSRHSHTLISHTLHQWPNESQTLIKTFEILTHWLMLV